MDAQLDQYCKGDVSKFCADVTPGEGRTQDCLVGHTQFPVGVGCYPGFVMGAALHMSAAVEAVHVKYVYALTVNAAIINTCSDAAHSATMHCGAASKTLQSTVVQLHAYPAGPRPCAHLHGP